MLFNKFQYDKSEITKNDYFQTGVVKDEDGTLFLAKWILDIPKDSQKSKILSDKLRHLQKAVHPLLPQIVQYGYDEEEDTYAIVYEYIGHYTLKDYGSDNHNILLSGLVAVADCLCALHTKNVISHGNLTPDNILIDSYYGFHLMNFGLADIAKTLGKGDSLSPFDPEFAAPEKFAKVKGGFPYQADIYSFGKIIEWVFESSTIYTLSESDQCYLRERLLAEDPARRPTWNEVVNFAKRICFADHIGYIRANLTKIGDEYWSNMNSAKPRFCNFRRSKDEKKIYMSIDTDIYRFYGIWLVRSKNLIVLGVSTLKKKPKQNRALKSFEFDVLFDRYHASDDEIGTSFLEWLSEYEQEKNNKKISRKLDSYDERMDKDESLSEQLDDNSEQCSQPQTFGSHIRYQNKSLNLNAVDVIESDSTTGENWLSPNREDPKRAVIELSTKAVKWLIPKVDNETIRKSFSFDHFIPQAVKTETGNGLDKDNVMNMAYFKKKVMPTIRRAAREVKNNGVDVVHCVASAAYRNATNRQEIMDLIKSETGLEVCVLSKNQEAECTLWGYLCADNSGEIKNVRNILLIDMGGGSTEVTLFQDQKKTFSHSFKVGTTALKNYFLGQDRGSVVERLEITDKKYHDQLVEELFDANIPEIKEETLCICVGTPVTAALGPGGKTSRRVHNRLLTMSAINESIQNRTEELSAKSIEEIVEILNEKGEAAQTFEKRLSSRLGLPLVATIIRAFQVHALRISGVGLWYGVFYKNFWNIK